MEKVMTEGGALQEFTVKYYEDQLIKGIENFHPGGVDYTEKLARGRCPKEGPDIGRGFRLRRDCPLFGHEI